MFTNDFKRLLVGFVMGDTLMKLRLATKAWKLVVDAFIDEGVRSGAIIVHDGKDISVTVANARRKISRLATRAIFLLNITNVGKWAYFCAVNLVVVDIPKAVKSIGYQSFGACESLTTVSFPTTLTSIGQWAFGYCSCLDNIDLLHTNLQELGGYAFWKFSELKSMTIPDSLQTLGDNVFYNCSKLVPSSIDISDEINDDDVTSEVVAHLSSQQE